MKIFSKSTIISDRSKIHLIFIFIVLALFFVIGFMIAESHLFGFLILGLEALVIYLFILYGRPLIALIISFLGIFSFFGFMPKEFLYFQGIFKLQDLFFILPFISFIWVDKNRLREIFFTTLGKAILFFLFVWGAVFIWTIWKYNIPITLIFKESRVYLYYLWFFVIGLFLRGEDQIDQFLKVMFCILLVFSIAYILQSLLSYSTSIDLIPYTWKMIPTGYGARVYTPGKRIPALGLLCAVGILAINRNFGHRKFYLFSITVFALETALVFGRAHWIGILIGLVLGWFLLFGFRLKMRFVKQTMILALAFTIVIAIVLVATEGDILSGIHKRFMSIIPAVKYRSGSLGTRLEWAKIYFDTILENPIFGAGFVHSSLPILPPLKKAGNEIIRQTTDLGILNLFLDMGFLGAIGFLTITVAFLKRGISLFHSLEPGFYKGVLFGIIAWYIGRLVSWNLGYFTQPKDIVVTTTAIAIVESIYRREKLMHKVLDK